MKIETGQFYKHFKTGKLYKILAVGKNSETLEPMVVYEAQYDNPESKVWIRPLSMFDQEVEREGKKFRRFEQVLN